MDYMDYRVKRSFYYGQTYYSTGGVISGITPENGLKLVMAGVAEEAAEAEKAKAETAKAAKEKAASVKKQKPDKVKTAKQKEPAGTAENPTDGASGAENDP